MPPHRPGRTIGCWAPSLHEWRTDDDRGRPGRLLLQVDSDGISGFTFDYGGLLRVWISAWISAAAPSLPGWAACAADIDSA
jgi:hypothetical protein